MSRKNGDTMKKYYINGAEITEAEALKQEQINREALNSGDLSEMLKIRFITVIERS